MGMAIVTMSRVSRVSGAVCLLLLLQACSSQKEPAQAAFAQVQASVAPVSAELERYAPAEFEQLQAQIDEMKARLNTKDYEGALAARTKVMAALASASSVAGKQKNELSKQLSGVWKDFMTDMPKLLSQLNSRLAYLQGVVRLPAEVSADALQKAKEQVPELIAQWDAAVTLMKSRDADTAVSKAQAVRKRAIELGNSLGLKLGPD